MTYASIITTTANFNARAKSVEIPMIDDCGTIFAPKSKCMVLDTFMDESVNAEMTEVLVPWWVFTNKDTNPIYAIYYPSAEAKKADEWKRAYVDYCDIP